MGFVPRRIVDSIPLFRQWLQLLQLGIVSCWRFEAPVPYTYNALLNSPQLDNSAPSVDSLLRKVLSGMDQDVFTVTSSKFEQKHLSDLDLFVDQRGSLTSTIPVHLATSTRTLAILDRTGSVDIAAKAIATARLSVNGTSPYSPDLVIVNEYIKDSFSSACLQHAANSSQYAKIRNVTEAEKSLRSRLEQAEAKGQVKIHRSPGTDLNIVELQDAYVDSIYFSYHVLIHSNRNSPLVSMKITGPYIILLSSTGLVDSITTQRDATTFLATYHFASPAAAKFLSEQIPSHASYVNQIPAQLLSPSPSPSLSPKQ